MLKRALDIAVAGTALLLFAPLMLLVAVAVRLTMGSPVLFRQIRPGRHARPFRLAKFRTMLNEVDRAGRPLSDGERLTAIGRFLRRTSIDELPQLWNVLIGDMSLVGPRPLLMAYLPRYDAVQARRHEVRPGVTGWAQVNGRNAISWDRKFELDVWYVDHRSIALDLRILVATAINVVRRHGISAADSATMPEFMGSRRQPGVDDPGSTAR